MSAQFWIYVDWDWIDHFDEDADEDFVNLDFLKAFDKIDHTIVLKMKLLGIDWKVL